MFHGRKHTSRAGSSSPSRLAVRRRARFALALCAGAWLTACNGIPKPQYPHADAEQALLLHRLTRERVQSIQAEARVDQRGERGRVRGTVLMFVERPARVRLDAMTQFGPVAILTIDGGRFAYSDLREQRYYTGDTCPRNIARLLSLPMTAEQATPLLLGGTAVIAHQKSEIVWHEDGFYRVTLTARDGTRQQIDFGLRSDDRNATPEAQRLRLLRSQIVGPDGHVVWEAEYGDYRVLEVGAYAVAMPFEVHVRADLGDTDTLIRFKEMRLEGGVPEEAFTQRPRAGMQQEELACD